MSAILKVAAVWGLLVLSMFWRAWVMQKVWAWHLAAIPVPALNHMIGLGVLVDLFVGHPLPEADDKEDVRRVVWLFAMPAVGLLIGWVSR